MNIDKDIERKHLFHYTNVEYSNGNRPHLIHCGECKCALETQYSCIMPETLKISISVLNLLNIILLDSYHHIDKTSEEENYIFPCGIIYLNKELDKEILKRFNYEGRSMV